MGHTGRVERNGGGDTNVPVAWLVVTGAAAGLAIWSPGSQATWIADDPDGYTAWVFPEFT